MNPLTIVLHQKQADDAAIQRLLQREGGTNKITVDTGGVTRGGIAESSGMPAAQIRSLTPAKINKIWGDKWKATEGITHPGVREIFYDMRANMGEPRANRVFQRSVNSLLPQDRQIKPDGIVGSGSLAAANSAPADALADSMMKRFREHHEGLVAKNPKKYGPYAKGWASRRNALWQSPYLKSIQRPQSAATPVPKGTVKPIKPPILSAGKMKTPVLVQGALSPAMAPK